MELLSRRVAAAAALACALVASPPAPGQEVDQYGARHRVPEETDRYTVLDFAASWCEPCARTLPRLADLAAHHPELQVLVVSVDDEEAGRDRLVERLGLELPVLWDGDHRIVGLYSPEALPATVVLDPHGREVYRQTGSDRRTWERLVRFIESLEP